MLVTRSKLEDGQVLWKGEYMPTEISKHVKVQLISIHVERRAPAGYAGCYFFFAVYLLAKIASTGVRACAMSHMSVQLDLTLQVLQAESPVASLDDPGRPVVPPVCSPESPQLHVAARHCLQAAGRICSALLVLIQAVFGSCQPVLQHNEALFWH